MEPARLRLPFEVIERVIGHAGDHLETLCSFSLTCHQLRPRALCLMVGRAILCQGGNRTFAFVDMLEAKPHLKPLVRSIVVDPTEFAPFPLLHSRIFVISRRRLVASCAAGPGECACNQVSQRAVDYGGLRVCSV
ncbi:hypothetical protein GSI_01472 [Ganoderma sinense ZZ0214-1]|uniref:F-box domain-containing protein n=1 Tax=Ganoderma sinense ZZ0214-1 TaxID=1077348 RepID=A0A2G8SPY9_9APHY|nr:hypothetical protein GSI_01472 [Ganoderma sinense ZZ0214-1]